MRGFDSSPPMQATVQQYLLSEPPRASVATRSKQRANGVRPAHRIQLLPVLDSFSLLLLRSSLRGVPRARCDCASLQGALRSRIPPMRATDGGEWRELASPSLLRPLSRQERGPVVLRAR